MSHTCFISSFGHHLFVLFISCPQLSVEMDLFETKYFESINVSECVTMCKFIPFLFKEFNRNKNITFNEVDEKVDDVQNTAEELLNKISEFLNEK